jgi:molybdate transport system substrate-binding protein
LQRIILILSLLLFIKSSSAETITVSAAASLKDVLSTLARRYQSQSRDKIRFNFASSGTLQRQIENGAPVDFYIAAADKNMNELQSAKLIDAATRRVLARNRLVLIVPKNSQLNIRSFRDLAKPEIKRIAMGAPQSVPAGRYAEQVLSKLGIWRQVQRKAVRGKDVREVLTQVEQGNVDAGIVYRTDAATSSKVRVVSFAPENFHSPIRYPMAIVADSKKKNAAKKFEAFLMGASAKRVLRNYRFVVG